MRRRSAQSVHSGAAEIYAAILQEDRENAEALAGLAQCYLKSGDLERARAAFVARQPLGRLGSAEEIAALVVHLASDESGYTTGAIHVIDGGWSI